MAAVSDSITGLIGADIALTLLVVVQAPRPVGALMPDEPVDAVLHRLLGPRRPAFAADQLGPGQPLPARERGRDVRSPTRGAASPTIDAFFTSDRGVGPARAGANWFSERISG